MRASLSIAVALWIAGCSLALGQRFDPQPAWSWDGLQGQGTGITLAVVDADGNLADDVFGSEPFYFTPCCPSVNQQGAAVGFLSSTAGPSTSVNWFHVGESSGTTLAFRMAPAGDVNGDGFEEIVYSSGSGFGDGTHSIWLDYGSPLGPATRWEYDSGLELGSLSGPVTSGDFNGDGYDDVAGGIRFWPSNNQKEGQVLVFFGGTAGLSTVPDQSWSGGVQNRQLGTGLASAGDVDGDGFDDLLVIDADAIVRLWRGSATGFDPGSPDWTYDSGATVGIRLSAAAAGDVNADGFGDFVIAPWLLAHASGVGSVRLFLGGPNGPAAVADQELFGDGSFGYSTLGAGDVNGDGFDDVAVGVRGTETVKSGAKLFLGSSTGLVPTPAWTNGASPDFDGLGASLGAGDVNADGYIDLIVGDEVHPRGVHAFLGQPGLVPGPAGTIDGGAAGRLRVGKASDGRVRLDWGESCSAQEEDFAVYGGDLGSFAITSPRTCTTLGRLWFELEPEAGDRFWLVVPQSADREGSYGRDADAIERLPSAEACRTQELGACVG